MNPKKELLEQRLGLLTSEQEQLARLKEEKKLLEGDELSAYEARQAELKQTDEEIAGIERLEAATRRNAERQASLTPDLTRTPGATVHNNAEDRPWESHGHFLQAVAYAGMGIGPIDVRLAPAGANTGVPGDGGFLVQKDFSTTLLAKATEAAVLAPLCMQLPISSNANGIKLPIVNETSRATGSRWGGIRVYWMEEAGTLQATKPTLDKLELDLKKLGALFYATDELLTDASALQALAEAGFASEFAFVLDDAIWTGNGAGMPLGILNAACLVTQDKVSGQTATTIIFENISEMWTRIPARSKMRGKWFINGMITSQLDKMSIQVGTGGSSAYLPAQGLASAPLGTLKGRPIVEIEQALALGTVGDIVFCDFSEYVLATKGGINAASSMHVKFITDEMTFRWIRRVDGQPAWTSAVTPYKGGAGATKSPFVALQTRS